MWFIILRELIFNQYNWNGDMTHMHNGLCSRFFLENKTFYYDYHAKIMPIISTIGALSMSVVQEFRPIIELYSFHMVLKYDKYGNCRVFSLPGSFKLRIINRQLQNCISLYIKICCGLWNYNNSESCWQQLCLY